ncbi:hypothetical protein ACOME3_008743 [Neoechinorhynchus agilis]
MVVKDGVFLKVRLVVDRLDYSLKIGNHLTFRTWLVKRSAIYTIYRYVNFLMIKLNLQKSNNLMSKSRKSINKRNSTELQIVKILTTPSAKQLLALKKSKTSDQIHEFCRNQTREECTNDCPKIHFHRIVNPNTDTSLGHCSFLNTCFHVASCKYVHYQIEDLPMRRKKKPVAGIPPQWIQCDIRKFDLSCLGKFSIIMADPPWDIHMELPYGTMADDEMWALNIPSLQDEGYIFLWVTGRAMERGRECLKIWGYTRVDEIAWVKINQLPRIIRTGRTGHWLNHGKEHCLVAVKGNLATSKFDEFYPGIDCDVIVSEVRATSRKPDEIYGIIERLSPGTRKIELFGRPHNVHYDWITLGNQLDGIHLVDKKAIKGFRKRYKDVSVVTEAIASVPENAFDCYTDNEAVDFKSKEISHS